MAKSYRQAILDALEIRGAGKTICPSEILPLAERKNPLKMRRVRQVARGLVSDGIIEITSKGKVIDLDQHRGPIRLRLKKS